MGSAEAGLLATRLRPSALRQPLSALTLLSEKVVTTFQTANAPVHTASETASSAEHNLVTRCPDLRSSHRPGRAARPSTNISDKTSIRFCTNWPAQQQILQTTISPKPAG